MNNWLTAFDYSSLKEHDRLGGLTADSTCSLTTDTAKKAQPVTTPELRYRVKRIQKNGPATIVFWQDGTKTIVRRGEDEPDSDYAAFTAALARKIYGSNSAVKRIVSTVEYQKEKGWVQFRKT